MGGPLPAVGPPAVQPRRARCSLKLVHGPQGGDQRCSDPRVPVLAEMVHDVSLPSGLATSFVSDRSLLVATALLVSTGWALRRGFQLLSYSPVVASGSSGAQRGVLATGYWQ